MILSLSPLRLAPLSLALLLAACGGTRDDEDAVPTNAQSATEANAAAPAALAAIPKPFLGRWDANDAACAGAGSEMRLVVAPESLSFHESLARVEAVRPEGEGAVALDLVFEGEGERWTETRTLRLGLDGRLAVEAKGGTAHRVRCDTAPGNAITAPAAPPAAKGEARWQAGSGGEEASLSLGAGAGRRLTLACPSGGGMLVVNVPAFRAIGSEERMSLGSGGTVFALVADPAGDKKRGGVTAQGAFPAADLAVILTGPEGIGVNYGAQNSGPHAPPPPALARAFLAACRAG